MLLLGTLVGCVALNAEYGPDNDTGAASGGSPGTSMDPDPDTGLPGSTGGGATTTSGKYPKG